MASSGAPPPYTPSLQPQYDPQQQKQQQQQEQQQQSQQQQQPQGYYTSPQQIIQVQPQYILQSPAPAPTPVIVNNIVNQSNTNENRGGGLIYTRVQTFSGYKSLACVVFWCCGCLFGLIAYILAKLAGDAASAGDATEAKKLSRASLCLSIIGIIVGVIVIGIIFGTQPKHTGY